MNKRRLTIITVCIVAAIIIIVGIDYFVPGEPSTPVEPLTPVREIEPPAPAEETGSPAEPVEPSITIKAPSEQLPSTFEQKMENLRKVIADVSSTSEAQELTLVFTEAEVNEQAAKRLTSTEISEDLPMEINSVHVDLKTGNNIVAKIGAVIFGFTGTVKIESQVGIEDGKPVAEVTDVSVPLPGVKETISELAQQKIEELLDQLTGPELVGNEEVDLEYLEINTQEEDITIKLLAKPQA